MFRREDFERPGGSPLFRALADAPDTRLRDLASVFQSITALPPHAVPPIDGQIDAPPRPKGAAWLQDHLPAKPEAPAANQPSPPTAPAQEPTPARPAEPAWLRDFLGPQQFEPARFATNLTRQRMAVFLSLAFTLLAWLAVDALGVGVAVPVLVTVAATIGSFSMVVNSYRKDPTVLAQRAAQNELRRISRRTHGIEVQLGQLERSKSQVERVYERQRERIAGRQKQSLAAEKDALARNERKLQQALVGAQQRRDRQQKLESAALQQLETQHKARLTEVDQQIGELRQAETAELQKILAQRQEQFVTSYLRRQTIEAAIITGIGPVVKQRLREHGLVRATDIDAARLAQVQGIGDGRATVLLDWRRRVEALARQTAPQSLSKVEETLIRGRFYQKRFSVEQEKGRAQRKLAKSVDETRARFAALLQAADQEQAAVHTKYNRKRDELRQRYRDQRSRLQSELADLDKQLVQQQAGLQQELASVQQELAQLNAQRAVAELRLRQFEGIDFSSYLKRVIMVFQG